MSDDPHRPVSVEVLVTADDGAFSVLDVRAPAGTSLPPHVCSREDSVLLVLSGRVEVVAAGGLHGLGAGDHLALPRSVPRRARVITDARLLCVAMPAGVECLATVLRPPPPDQDDVAALLAAAGVDLLPRNWGLAAR